MTPSTIPLLPVRRLHNFSYCPRLFYLQWVENLWVESADTAAGSHLHRNTDKPTRWTDDLDLAERGAMRSIYGLEKGPSPLTINALLENPYKRQIAITSLIVEPIPDHKLVTDIKSHIVGLHLFGTLFYLC